MLRDGKIVFTPKGKRIEKHVVLSNLDVVEGERLLKVSKEHVRKLAEKYFA